MKLADVFMLCFVSYRVNMTEFHFISFYIFYEGYPSAKLVFKGPSFKKRKKYIYKVKYNLIINREEK